MLWSLSLCGPIHFVPQLSRSAHSSEMWGGARSGDVERQQQQPYPEEAFPLDITMSHLLRNTCAMVLLPGSFHHCWCPFLPEGSSSPAPQEAVSPVPSQGNFSWSTIITPELLATAPDCVPDSFSLNPTACLSDNQSVPKVVSNVVPLNFPSVAFVLVVSEGLTHWF